MDESISSPWPDLASPMSTADTASPAAPANALLSLALGSPGQTHETAPPGSSRGQTQSDQVVMSGPSSGFAEGVPGSNPGPSSMECESEDEAMSLGARPKMVGNVIVDDSPLQNQMQKNKECKQISSLIVFYVMFHVNHVTEL